MSDLKSIERCVGDYRILWAFHWAGQVAERKPDPDCSMDTVFSHWGDVEGTFHIVAPTEELARAGWESSTEGHIYHYVRHEKLLVVNMEVRKI